MELSSFFQPHCKFSVSSQIGDYCNNAVRFRINVDGKTTYTYCCKVHFKDVYESMADDNVTICLIRKRESV